MPSDQEYLQSANIQDTPTEAAPAAEAPPSPAEAKAEEMFELSGHKFPVSTEFQFAHGGNIEKMPYSKMVNIVRQARHMQDKWADFKKLQAESSEKYKDYDQLKGFYDKYGRLQEWSEKNPDQWNALYELWQNRDKHILQNQLGQNTQNTGFNAEPLVNEIAALKAEMQDYKQWKADQQRRATEEQEAKDTDYIKSQVQQFAKDYSEIDIAEKDPDGIPLWAKIVDWGNQKGYPDFESAALVYLKQRIVDVERTRARNEAMKSAKQEHKEGIVMRSATPIMGQKPNSIDRKKMSYAELAELAKNGALSTGT